MMGTASDMQTNRETRFEEASMTSQTHPQLPHRGVYARDIDRMVAFYTKTIGRVVADRCISSRGGELPFMTAAPGHHHQLVVVSGRAPEGVSTVNQLSFPSRPSRPAQGDAPPRLR